MKNKNEILDELRELAPALSRIQRISPFKVPENYFNQLSSDAEALGLDDDPPMEILNKLKGNNPFKVPFNFFDELSESVDLQLSPLGVSLESPLLDETASKDVFSVPQNYFDTLYSETVANVDSSNEVVESQQIDSAAAIHGFKLPDNFFQKMHDNIMQEVEQVSSEMEGDLTLSVAPQRNFSVPNSYFENLESSIRNKVEWEAELPEVLTGISNDSPFTVPKGYFEELRLEVESKISSGAEGGKVVEMKPWSTLKVVRVLASAAAIFALFFIGFNYLPNSGSNNSNVSEACILPIPDMTMESIVSCLSNNFTTEELELFITSEEIVQDKIVGEEQLMKDVNPSFLNVDMELDDDLFKNVSEFDLF